MSQRELYAEEQNVDLHDCIEIKKEESPHIKYVCDSCGADDANIEHCPGCGSTVTSEAQDD